MDDNISSMTRQLNNRDIMTTYEAVVTLGAFVVGAKILSMVAQSIITDLIMTIVLAYVCKMLAPNNKALNGEWEARAKKNAEWCGKLVDVVKNPKSEPMHPRGAFANPSIDPFRFSTRALPEPQKPFLFPAIVPPQGGVVITEAEAESDDEWYVGECPGCEGGVDCTGAHRDKCGDLHPNCCARGGGDEYLGDEYPGDEYLGVGEFAPLAFASPEMATIATGKYSSYEEAYKKIVLKDE